MKKEAFNVFGFNLNEWLLWHIARFKRYFTLCYAFKLPCIFAEQIYHDNSINNRKNNNTNSNKKFVSRIANRVPSIEMENGQSNSIIGLKYQTIVIYGCFHSAHTHTHKILILIIYLYSVFIFPFPVMLDFIHCGSNFIWFLTLNFVHLQLWHSINPNRIEFDDGAYQNGHSKL